MVVELGVGSGVKSNVYSDSTCNGKHSSLDGLGVGQIVLLYVISKSGQIPL